MGSRANLLVVNETGYELYYCHSCAQYLDIYLFWGPDATLDSIRQYDPASHDEDGWLDEAWSDGGVVLDLPRRVLLFYGGEDIDLEIPLRRLLLELMQYNWQGWTIRWAHDGILDMADYVQLPRSIVETPVFRDAVDRPVPSGAFVQPGELEGFVPLIASLRDSTGAIRLYPMRGSDKPGWLARSSALVEALIANEGVSTWVQTSNQIPYGGFHIDIPAKKLSVWEARSHGIVEHIQAHWSGWQIEWLRDNFEAHIALTENNLVLHLPSSAELLSRLETILLYGYIRLAKNKPETVESLQNETRDSEVTPIMLIEASRELRVVLEKRIFDATVAKWKSEHENS